MVSREIWEKHALMSFSKTHKLHSSFGLVQFCTLLKNSLVHVFPKLHSKPYYYLYKLHDLALGCLVRLHNQCFANVCNRVIKLLIVSPTKGFAAINACRAIGTFFRILKCSDKASMAFL